MKNKIIVILSILISSYSLFAQDSENKGREITGIIVNSVTQNPLPGITVRVLDTKLGAVSKPDGRFTIKKVPPGIYAVQFTGVGLERYVQANVVVSSGRPVMLEIQMVEKIIELKGAEVKSSYFPKRIESATSTQSLNAEDIRRAPGVQEDVIRATALLPGVGVTQAGRNDLIVRGGAPFENLFIVDGIEVPNINHFGSQGASGGPLSLINIDLVKSVDFSAGGFGAKYGDKVSSITNISLRNGNNQRFSGQANLSATGAGLIAEGPIGEAGSYLISLRRSYLDLLFKAAGFSFVPQYWDIQAKVNYKIDNSNYLTFLTIGALDDISLNNENADNRYDNSRFAAQDQNQYFSGLSWKTLFGKGFATFTLGRTFTTFDTFQNDSLGSQIFKNISREGENSFSADFDFQLSPKTEFKFGNKSKYASQLDYDVIIPGERRKDNNGNPVPLNIDTNFTTFRNASYVSLTTAVGKNKLTIGGRADYYNYLENSFYFSPRLSFLYQLNDASAFIMSAGRFYQSPSLIWLIGGSEKELKPIRADQVVLAYQHTPLEDLKVQLEVYYKWYANYPARVYRPQAVLSPSGFDDITSDIPFGLEPLSSTGTGFSRGIELLIQKKLSSIPLYGLLSVTISESRFTSLNGEENPGAFDTRFIMNLAAGYRFNSEWELSSKFRISTGIPTTPYKEDLSGELDYTRYNEGERLPVFNALDVRLDKRWNFDSFSMITYIDIQNIYGKKNISAVRWDYRTLSPEFNESIGILPSIGITVQF